MDNILRASQFVGKPVVTQSGKQIELIGDIIFDPQTHQALCFVIAPGGGWFGGAEIIPWSGDFSIEANAVKIPSEKEIVMAYKIPHIQEILESAQVSPGMKIATSGKRRIGILNDVYFNGATGEIQVYEVVTTSQHTGFIERAFLEPDETEFVRSDSLMLVISRTTAELIEDQISTS